MKAGRWQSITNLLFVATNLLLELIGGSCRPLGRPLL